MRFVLALIGGLLISLPASAQFDFNPQSVASSLAPMNGNTPGKTAFENEEYERALGIFRRQAELGDTASINNLGVMFEFGIGVPKDKTYARQHYLVAAKEHLALAQYNLGASFIDDLLAPDLSIPETLRTERLVAALCMIIVSHKRGVYLAAHPQNPFYERMDKSDLERAEALADSWEETKSCRN